MRASRLTSIGSLSARGTKGETHMSGLERERSHRFLLSSNSRALLMPWTKIARCNGIERARAPLRLNIRAVTLYKPGWICARHRGASKAQKCDKGALGIVCDAYLRPVFVLG
eukprot:scaffold23908_cov36-Tisochrysis_lutea.AAC.4